MMVNIEQVWEDGYGIKEWKVRKGELKRRRERLDGRLKNGLTDGNADTDGNGTVQRKVDLLQKEEFEQSVRMHLEELGREEKELEREERRLIKEKAAHRRALKRIASEDSSLFKHRPKVRSLVLLIYILK